MTKAIVAGPQAPFALFIRRCRRSLAGVVALSAIANMLSLTGSLYMLQVYDRVLPSRSLPTLVGLTVLMVGLYAAFGLLDLVRGRVMQGLAIRLDRQLREPVFHATLQLPLRLGDRRTALQPVRDLDQIRGFLAGPGPIALIDMPWLPFFLALVFLLHPLLGLLATAGAFVLVGLAALAELYGRKPEQSSTQAVATRQGFMEAVYRNAELVEALGLERRMTDRWEAQNEALLTAQRRAQRVSSCLHTVSRVFRLVLQSALLGLGAYVAIRGEATGGVMIATSVLTSRALAPIESAITNWRGFVSARQSYQRLSSLLAGLPDKAPPLALPAPQQRLTVKDLAVAAPGQRQPILQGITFTLQAGEGLGVIGPSASGKSTLARALAGAWLPQRGTIRLDGAALDQWDRNALGRHVGYLPQDLALFDGTIAENIARLEENAPSQAVIAAARAAGVHEMILGFPDGYGTWVGEGGAILSGGQRQRIALARALYGDPFFVVLDEPNSNLDAEGDAALTQAMAGVRARGGILVVIAHRPAALSAVDKLAVLGGGQLQAFGPKEQVLPQVIHPVGVTRVPVASQPRRQGDAA